MRRAPAREPLERIARRRGTLRSSRGRLAERLGARLTAPPGAARDYGLVLDHLDAELATAEDAVTTTENAYARARERAAACRKGRDQAFTGLREPYRRIQTVLGRLPIRGAEVLAVTPASPAALVQHVPLAIEVLRDLARRPPPKVIGVTIDADVLAGELEAGLGPLMDGLRALVGAETDLKFARVQAEEALGSARPVVKWVSEALAGLRGLADA